MDHLRDMALFVEVAKTRSFKRAAENLRMPSSTLSRRIAALEITMGLQLLNRTTRRTELTEAGHTYYDRCHTIVEEARAAHHELTNMAVEPSGQLRVAMPIDFGIITLAPLIVEFCNRYPHIQINLDLSSRVADLFVEPIDLAIRIGHLPDSSLLARRIYSGNLALYAAPAYLERAGHPSQPEDLIDHNCILLGSNYDDVIWKLNDDTRTAKVKVEGQTKVNTMGMAHRLCLLGTGIALLGSPVAHADVTSGDLRRVLPDWNATPVPIYIVSSSRLVPKAARLFIEFLTDQFANR